MATTKRVYKLQEFVAHASNVNCLKIGRRTSRVLVTGGEDYKVNLWAIGKPNAIMSLSGHLSPVESVSFDSSEAMVAAGAASGTIKLWDLEEAKIVRTLTGHRSNCISVDFHPFGEFFASGALDTNLKIWDIRKKGCIHTYKGHTRGVNAIRFTPDGRWVVSGGEDNIVKVWDLTAGKLIHEFKFHEGQIQCIDFHPNEFLLATGSTDRTVKFWDLETFELIGSAGPEASSVRSMTFSPDGRILLCGLHESLKVFSWEPVRCHETVDVGWSRFSDMNVHEGKLLGCSYNQSCVGVWVVDISQVKPYAKSSVLRSNGHSEVKSTTNDLSILAESNTKSTGRYSISENSEPSFRESKYVASTRSAPCTPQRSTLTSGSKTVPTNSTTSVVNFKRNSSKPHGTVNPQAINKFDVVPVLVPRTSARSEAVADSRKEAATSVDSSKESISSNDSRNSSTESGREGPLKVVSRNSARGEKTLDSRMETADGRVSAPVVLGSQGEVSDTTLSTNSRFDASLSSVKDVSRSSDSRKEAISGRVLPYAAQTKPGDFKRPAGSSDDSVRENLSGLDLSTTSQMSFLSDSKDIYQASRLDKVNGSDVTGVGARKTKSNRVEDLSLLDGHEIYDLRTQKPRETNSLNISKGSSHIDIHDTGKTRPLLAGWERKESSPVYDGPSSGIPRTPATAALRGRTLSSQRETVSASDEDAISDLMEQHAQFLNSAQHRVKKLQVVLRLWERNDVKGAIIAIDKMCDHAVSADLVSSLTAKSDVVTLEICACLLPLLSRLLESLIDRHLSISLEMLLKLVRTFGTVIRSTLSASSSVGVDIHAEQRLERCNRCFLELEKVKSCMPSLLRRGGLVGKSAQELNLALQEVV